MIQQVNIENIVSDNPNTDLETIEKATKIKEELKKQGYKKPGYQLERRRIKVVDEREIGEDQRTVSLSLDR